MTDTRHGSADLACLVNLTDPPPPPPDVYGVWKGGWVTSTAPASRSAPRTATLAGSAADRPATAAGRFTVVRRFPLPDRRHRAGVRQLRPSDRRALQR